MPRCPKLYEKALNNPAGLRFSELQRLAECWGYEEAGGKGSHVKYKHAYLKLPQRHAMQVFQPSKGEAKPYQVRQLLEAIEFIDEEYPDTYP